MRVGYRPYRAGSNAGPTRVRGGVKSFSFASTDGSTDQSYTIKLPVGKSMTIDWGDGNSDTYNGAGDSDITPAHSYAEVGSYDITFTGDYLELTYLHCYLNNLSGDVSGWSALVNLTNLRCYLNNLSGDVSSWSALVNLTYLHCNLNSLSGDVSGWSALVNLTYLRCDLNSLSGDVSGWSALVNLTYLRCNLNSLSGDVSGWSALVNLTDLRCDSNSLDFDSTTAWTALDLGTNCQFQNNSMTSTQVNNALIAFAGGPFENTTIDLSGNNDVRTSDSDAAVATLIAAGCTIKTQGLTEPTP